MVSHWEGLRLRPKRTTRPKWRWTTCGLPTSRSTNRYHSKVFREMTNCCLDAVFDQFSNFDSFAVKRRDAGLASVDVTVVNPLGKELPLEVKSLPNHEGDLVEFYPTLPGKYRFNVLYGGEVIPGTVVSLANQSSVLYSLWPSEMWIKLVTKWTSFAQFSFDLI